jgi:uncharacterized 2Fe-2S/4Fe-4S cluster protein (DUF4445 family)
LSGFFSQQEVVINSNNNFAKQRKEFLANSTKCAENVYNIIQGNAIIHLLHAGEENMKIYSSKTVIFPEGNARGEYRWLSV